MDLRDKADAEKWIKDKLGYSFDLFRSCILFGQSLKRITQEDGPMKKKVFDEAFETLFINRAKEIASKKLDDVSKEANELEIKLESHKNILAAKRSQYESALEVSKNFYVEKELKLGSLRKELREKQVVEPNIEADKNILKALQKFKTDWVEKEFKAYLNLNQNETSLENTKLRLKKLKGQFVKVPEVCDECGQKIPFHERLKVRSKIKIQIDKCQEELKGLEEKVSLLKKTHEKFKKKAEKYKVRESRKRMLEQKISNSAEKAKILQKWADNIKEEIRRVKKSKPPNLDLEIMEAGLEQEEHTIEGLQEKAAKAQKDLDTYNWLIQKPLSNSGLKAYIFEQMLSKVNKYTNQYKPIIGFGIKVYIDMASAHKNIMISVFKGSDEVPYEDLSGGQKQLVDVALALALNDTVNSIKPTNLLFMDEVFESLDEDNIEVVGDLITNKAKNKSIHLITHQSKFSPNNTHKTYVTLEEGRTQLSAS